MPAEEMMAVFVNRGSYLGLNGPQITELPDKANTQIVISIYTFI